jgi:hypothetical protein
MSPFTLSHYHGNATTHCHATVTVMLLWKFYKLTVMQQALLRHHGNTTNSLMQQALLRYYGNAIRDLTCHNINLLHGAPNIDLSRNSLPVIEPKCPLPCLQKPITGRCPETYE